MNIENLRKELEQGDTFTYKKLCEVLEEEYSKGGNAKKKQLEDWERYFEYEKIKTKIKILNIRNKPLPDVNKMLGKSKYYSDLETIILYALNETKDGVIDCSISKALEFTNMVNQNYSFARNNVNDVSEKLDIDRDYLYAFYNMSHAKLKKIFENALNTMVNKSLITRQDILMVCYEDENEKVITIENGKMKTEKKKKFRQMTDEENARILEIEREVFKILSCTDKQNCFMIGKWGEFRKLTIQKIQSELNILFYYNNYHIVTSKKIVEKEITERMSIYAKDNLNNNILKSIETSQDKTICNNKSDRHRLNCLLIDNTPPVILSDILNGITKNEELDYFDVT